MKFVQDHWTKILWSLTKYIDKAFRIDQDESKMQLLISNEVKYLYQASNKLFRIVKLKSEIKNLNSFNKSDKIIACVVNNKEILNWKRYK